MLIHYIIHYTIGRSGRALVFPPPRGRGALEWVSLCFYILPSRWYPNILDQVCGRIVYPPIFGLRAVSLCFYILPPRVSLLY